jgi:hypothetical protein
MAPKPENQHKYDYCNGVWLRKDEFPLTEEEELELYRRMGKVVTYVRREPRALPIDADRKDES